MSYKFSYLNVRARGEPIRWLLRLLEVDFTEDTIDVLKEWKQRQPGFEWGRTPVLTVDGVSVHQTLVICRLLAEKHGLPTPSDPLQKARVEEVAEALHEVFNGFADTIHARHDQSEAVASTAKAAGKRLLEVLRVTEGTITRGGWIRSEEMTWVDVFCGCMLDSYAEYVPGVLKNFPNLQQLKQKVSKLPKIADWIRVRPPFIGFEDLSGIEFI